MRAYRPRLRLKLSIHSDVSLCKLPNTFEVSPGVHFLQKNIQSPGSQFAQYIHQLLLVRIILPFSSLPSMLRIMYETRS